MGAYLYCIAPIGTEPESGLRGIDDAAVEVLPWSDFAVWLSRLPQRPEPSIERIRSHNAVVEAALAVATPVPLRFGQWLADEATVGERIATREDEFRAALARLSGAVEFGVRVLDPAREAVAAEQESAASGRDYMLRLAGRERLDERANTVADELAAAVEGVVREARVRPLPSEHGLLSVAHLVGRHDISTYRSTLDSFRDRFGELRFLVSGPWPPYSFVE